jgi:hypothetical protein
MPETVVKTAHDVKEKTAEIASSAYNGMLVGAEKVGEYAAEIKDRVVEVSANVYNVTKEVVLEAVEKVK